MSCPDQSPRCSRPTWTRASVTCVTGRRGSQFVEFDFAIGEPELFVEMILTHEAFAEFCRANQVRPMAALPEVAGEDEDDARQWDWRLADATRFVSKLIVVDASPPVKRWWESAMHIDLRTVSIQPLRQTFDHLARRFGDKPSSRYQEGSYDIRRKTCTTGRPGTRIKPSTTPASPAS
jgi:phenol hydroxylase P0 protein